ncbi:MAG: hypothetical protein N838_22615 [Thiohalocapsa sp. PB-PSB1]|nr:MAG: hypothetical protein N838_22615 [Thiohalocapsa sp. PB-PSB1]
MVLSESFRRRRTAAGAVDRVDDRLHDLQDVAAEALSLAIVAVLQAVCLADQMCQAALALLEVAVDVVAVAHQPVAEGFTEHFTHDRTRAPSDDEQGGGGTGEHPQPQQLSGLLPTGLIGPLDVNDQVDVAQGLQHLRIHHRLHCTPGVVALLNPRTTCQSGQGCSTGDSLMRWSKEAGRGVLGIYRSVHRKAWAQRAGHNDGRFGQEKARHRRRRARRWLVQLRYACENTGAEYVAQQAWLSASLRRCPLHSQDRCGFAGLGFRLTVVREQAASRLWNGLIDRYRCRGYSTLPGGTDAPPDQIRPG